MATVYIEVFGGRQLAMNMEVTGKYDSEPSTCIQQSVPGTTPRPPLPERFEIIVIGGGINGVAIARECARGGRRVLLLEKDDFGAGTTSRSTRIIHGGLRYLENGEIGLVRESLRERERLLCERPHLIRPTRFVFALNESSRHSAMELRAGLWLYRQLGGSGNHGIGPKADLLELEKNLDRGHRWSLFDYEDAQCEYPERLVAEWLSEALQSGLEARNHMEVLEVRTQDDRVQGVVVRDHFTGDEQYIRAEWVVNATGPWADRVYATTKLKHAEPMIGGVRGSHIVVPTFKGAPKAAVYSEASDGRPGFVIPWIGQILVGTTEIPNQTSPDQAHATVNEITYLLEMVNRLFPSAKLSRADISYTFSGIRPLPYQHQGSPHSVTRRHMIRNHAEEGAMGMLSIIGGKLTTAAELARQCARRMGVRVRRPGEVRVAAGPASGIESTVAQWARVVSEQSGISECQARAIAGWHGSRALAIIQSARQDEKLRQPLCEHSEHIVAEAIEAARFECAMTLSDILLRRVPVALSPCFSGECARTAATRIAGVLCREADIEEGLERFHLERSAFLRKPGVSWSDPVKQIA
jgi:glycerol-3-phosphate dehydrogenase